MGRRNMIRPFIAILFASLICGPAYSDNWRNGRALISCYPGAGFFELQSLQVYPEGISPEFGKPVVPEVFSPEELEQEPFVCELPGSDIIVEGRNMVTGTGPCGARNGAEVRVSVNGVPVAFDFEKSPSGLTMVSKSGQGWIELSDCFERAHSVTIHSIDGFTEVELCRLQNGKRDPSTGLTPVSGMCKFWSGFDDTFKEPTR